MSLIHSKSSLFWRGKAYSCKILPPALLLVSQPVLTAFNWLKYKCRQSFSCTKWCSTCLLYGLQEAEVNPKCLKWLQSAREYDADYLIVCMFTPQSLNDFSFSAALRSLEAQFCSLKVCTHDWCLSTLVSKKYVCLLSFDLPLLLCLFVLHTVRRGLLAVIVCWSQFRRCYVVAHQLTSGSSKILFKLYMFLGQCKEVVQGVLKLQSANNDWKVYSFIG